MRQKTPSEKFRSFGRLTLLTALLVMPLWGCSTTRTYKGPELPKSEVSVIHRVRHHGTVLPVGYMVIPFPSESRHFTQIRRLDGEQYGGYVEFHVLPGKHSATVHYTRFPPITLCGYYFFACIFDYQADLSIDFTTEVGHEYSIPAERREGRDWIWVEDITTAKVVAGEKPPPEPPPSKEPAEEEPTP